MEDQRCNVCLDDAEPHRILDCLHHFCHKCLHNIQKFGDSTLIIRCPECRHVTNLSYTGLGNLPIYGHESEQRKENPIDDLEFEGPAELSNTEYCPEHPEFLVSCFCYDCRNNFCAECILDNHQRHRLEEIIHTISNQSSPPQTNPSPSEPIPALPRMRGAVRPAQLQIREKQKANKKYGNILGLIILLSVIFIGFVYY